MSMKERGDVSLTVMAERLGVSQATVSRVLREDNIKPVRVDGKDKFYSEGQYRKACCLILGNKVRQITHERGSGRRLSELEHEVEELGLDEKVLVNMHDRINDQLELNQADLDLVHESRHTSKTAASPENSGDHKQQLSHHEADELDSHKQNRVVKKAKWRKSIWHRLFSRS